jgi:hypothetical protein
MIHYTREIAISFIILFLVLPLPLVNARLTLPNFYFSIENPIDSSSISTSSFIVKFSVSNAGLYVMVESMQINAYLDGQLFCQPQLNFEGINNAWSPVSYGEFVLSDLSQGNHTIEINATVHAKAVSPGYYNGSIPSVSTRFSVNLGITEPKVSISCLDEYKTNSAALNLTSNLRDSIVSYNLDGKENVTLPQNRLMTSFDGYQYTVTLTNLVNGTHNLKAYAKTLESGIGVAEKTFTVNTTNQQPSQQPTQEPDKPFTNLAVTSGIIIAGTILASVALLLFRKKPE